MENNGSALGIIGATVIDGRNDLDTWIPKKDEILFDFSKNMVRIGDGITVASKLEIQGSIF